MPFWGGARKGHPLWVNRAGSEGRWGVRKTALNGTQPPHFSPGVGGVGEKTPGETLDPFLMPFPPRGVEGPLGQKPLQPSGPFFARPGLPMDAQPWPKPPPEEGKKVPPPAPEGLPAWLQAPSPEPVADLLGGMPQEKGAEKPQKDHGGGKPPAGIDLIGEDAEGGSAPFAQIPPDGDGLLGRGQAGIPPDLAVVDPVADDPKLFPGRILAQMAAGRAVGGAKLSHRGENLEI